MKKGNQQELRDYVLEKPVQYAFPFWRKLKVSSNTVCEKIRARPRIL